METAKEAYKKRREQIAQSQKIIDLSLKNLDKEFQKKDTSWAFVGSLGFVQSKLNEIEVFLNSSSK